MAITPLARCRSRPAPQCQSSPLTVHASAVAGQRWQVVAYLNTTAPTRLRRSSAASRTAAKSSSRRAPHCRRLAPVCAWVSLSMVPRPRYSSIRRVPRHLTLTKQQRTPLMSKLCPHVTSSATLRDEQADSGHARWFTLPRCRMVEMSARIGQAGAEPSRHPDQRAVPEQHHFQCRAAEGCPGHPEHPPVIPFR